MGAAYDPIARARGLRMRRILLDPFLCFWVPLGLAVVCVMPIWFARSRILVAGLRATSVSLVVLGILATAFWSWFFRDGLGPGFIPTTGWTAFGRFWQGFGVPLAIGAAETLAITMIFRRRLSTLRASASVPQ
jgi:hypothetical protein